MTSSLIQETPQRTGWMWKSNVDPWSNIEPDKWNLYSDIENHIIESAYQENKTQVELDDFSIDFERQIQINRIDSSKQKPIKRMVHMSDKSIREGRFTLEQPLNVISFRTQRSTQLCAFQSFKMALWLLRILLRMPSDDELPEFVEQAAKGIEEEGEKLGKKIEGEWIANELRKVKGRGKNEIGKCCVKLYTMESFLYRLVNTFQREVELEDGDWCDDFGRDHISEKAKNYYRTLGPYCLLLTHYLGECPKEKDTVVFQGATLTTEMIDNYKKHVGKDVLWDWLLSTTKNKEVALSCDGNTLFQIHIRGELYSKAVAISSLSEYPYEEEVLLDGVGITIKKVEYDETIHKHVIEVVA